MLAHPQFEDVPVLIVDDSAFARRMLRGMLRQVGIRTVVEAEDGADALARLTEFQPSLILLDWHLKMMAGRSLLNLVRDPMSSAAPDVPVIVITGHPTRKTIAEAMDVGANDVMCKPFSPRVLWTRVAHHVGRNAQERAERIRLRKRFGGAAAASAQ
jgi:two-component system, chemotaxis family, chemotaxis protein CheY